MKHRHRILDGRFGGHTLDGLDNDALGLLVGGEFGVVHDVVDVTCSGGLSLIAKRLHEFFFGLLGAESAHVLQRVAHGLFHTLHLLAAVVEHCLLVLQVHFQVIEVSLHSVHLIALALQFALLLVELHLALLEFGLAGLHFGKACVGLLLGFALECHAFLFSFHHLVALEHFGLETSLLNDFAGGRLRIATLEQGCYCKTCHKRYRDAHY